MSKMKPHPCKHCGNDETFFIKQQISGRGDFNVDAEGEPAEDNSGMHDGLTYRDSKHYYCGVCKKRNGPIENELDAIVEQFYPGGR